MNDNLRAYYEKALPSLRDAITASEFDGVSDPFLVEIPESYEQQRVRLMVVGQETHGWGEGQTTPLDKILERHRWFDLAREPSAGRARRSPFWRAAHRINERLGNDGDFVWANLVAVDRNKKRLPLSLRDRVREAAPGPGLLPKLVEVAAPEAVVFFVGPDGYYQHELNRQFPGVQRERVDGHTDRELIRLAHSALPAASFCSYHPGYLQRTGRWGNVDRIADLISAAASAT